jgi:hypothetical protein
MGTITQGAFEQVKLDFAERISRIFQYYCLYGEPLNASKLKSSKFMKMLRDSGLLLKGVFKVSGETFKASSENINQFNGGYSEGGVSQIEADLIFKKLT